MVGLKNLGYGVELACAPCGKLNDKSIENGIKVNSINHFRQEISPIHDLFATYELYRMIKRTKFHIIHTHNSKAGFIGRLAAFIARCPIIIHTCHGFSFHDEEPFVRKFLFILLERLAAKWSDFIIFISEPLILWAQKYNIKSKFGHKKIYSGIDFNLFKGDDFDIGSMRGKCGFKDGDFLIGLVSKLWEGKGIEYAVSAMLTVRKRVKDAKLVIVGEGYLKNKIEVLIKELDLKNEVILWGFTESVNNIIPIFDVTLLPSLFEGMGRVILESMAMKKAVVGTNVGGIPDLIEDGVTGILIPPKDSDAISSAIIKIANDGEFAKKIAENGYKKAHSHEFSIENMVSEIDLVYKSVIEAKGILTTDFFY